MKKLIDEVQKLQNWVKIYRQYPTIKAIKNTEFKVIPEMILRKKFGLTWLQFTTMTGYTKKYFIQKNTKFFKCKVCGKATKNKLFCSQSCGAKWRNQNLDRTHSEETKLKISKTSKGFSKKQQKYITSTRIEWCKECGKSFPLGKNKIFCNQTCKNRYYTKRKTDFKLYRDSCSFKFNVFNYPELFDIDKLKLLGWFSAVHDNLTGMSRDHLVSVRYGFDHNIPSWIISHICNCDLISHTKNRKKHSKCSLTLEQLMNKIEIWENKKIFNEV